MPYSSEFVAALVSLFGPVVRAVTAVVVNVTAIVLLTVLSCASAAAAVVVMFAWIRYLLVLKLFLSMPLQAQAVVGVHYALVTICLTGAIAVFLVGLRGISERLMTIASWIARFGG
jgi:hypothetical protein